MCWFIEFDSMDQGFLLLTKACFFNALLDSTVASTASICLHPRKLRACAEPRRASARRGEAPLVYIHEKTATGVFSLETYNPGKVQFATLNNQGEVLRWESWLQSARARSTNNGSTVSTITGARLHQGQVGIELTNCQIQDRQCADLLCTGRYQVRVCIQARKRTKCAWCVVLPIFCLILIGEFTERPYQLIMASLLILYHTITTTTHDHHHHQHQHQHQHQHHHHPPEIIYILYRAGDTL